MRPMRCVDFQHPLNSLIEQGIHVQVLFYGEGYDVTAGTPAIGLLALGVAACLIALSVLDQKRRHGRWVKGVKLMTTIYSSIALVVTAGWSFVERAGERLIGFDFFRNICALSRSRKYRQSGKRNPACLS